ncbi:MAG: radical SAM protein [Chitinophagales bacterium]
MTIFLTHGYFIAEDPKEQEIMRPYVPLGILCISAFLEEHGFDNFIFDSTFSTFEKLKEQLLSQQPDVIGIYTNLMTKLNVLRIIRFIKEHENLQHSKIILGGPEVRNHVSDFLKAGATVLVLGEGEQTMLELTQFYKGNLGKKLEEIQGIAFLTENGDVIKSIPRTNIRNMEELPFPNRSKVNLQLYFDAWKNKHGESAISVSTMRGCPYTCKWCSRAVYGQTYRRRTAKQVVEELALIQRNYSVDTIWFVDDVFSISHKWLREFAQELKQQQLKIRYECISRSDRMNEEVIRLLKESGCFRVWIGAESGSQKVIDAMDRRVEVNQVREMIQLSKQYGIQAGTFIMVGYPGETDEDVQLTLEHLKTSDPDQYTITVAYPIKGTPLYEEVESQFIEQLPWESSTDRQIDFKRTYSRKYYDYAVRWIYNEMSLQRLRQNANFNFSQVALYKLKSLASRSLMKWEMRKS